MEREALLLQLHLHVCFLCSASRSLLSGCCNPKRNAKAYSTSPRRAACTAAEHGKHLIAFRSHKLRALHSVPPSAIFATLSSMA